MYEFWLGIHVVGAISTIFMLGIIHKQKESQYKSYLMLTCVASLMIMVSRCNYIYSETAEGLLISAKMEYFGKCFANYFGLMFLMSYRQIKYPKLLTWVAFVINSVMCVVIFCVGVNNWYYKDIRLEQTPILGHVLTTTKQPLYYIYMIFIVSEMIAYVVIAFRSWLQTERGSSVSKASFMLVIAGVTPMLLLTMYLTGKLAHFDPVPIGAFISTAFMIIACLRYKLFELVHDAKDYVLENMDDGILVIDRDFHVVYGNPYALHLLEQPDFVPDDTTIHQFDYSTKIEVPYEYNGIIYKVTVSPLTYSFGKAGYLVQYTDVTYLEKKNEEMRELKEKAEAANLAKSSFISNISHEIRTPMNGIIGMTEILLRDNFTEQQEEYLHNIQTSGNTLLSIINDILDFSKIESGKFELANTSYDLLASFRDLSFIFLTRIGDKDIEFVVDIDPTIPRQLYGDAVRLRQIIINVVNNAIKYTDSGTIVLQVQKKGITGSDIVLEFSVSDTGQGIKEEDIPKLFQSFQRVDMKKNATKEGSGLGLSITKQLVELMGGEMLVESTYGEGSTFHFSLHHKIYADSNVTVAQPSSELKGKKICGHFTNPLLGQYFKKQVLALNCFHYVSYEDILANKEVVDFLFTDSALFDQVKAHCPKETKLCHAYNPVKELLREDADYNIQKPLYSSNICMILNGEKKEQHKAETGSNKFTAPGAQILIVDDNMMNRKVAAGLLKPLELQIDTASSGKEAIEMCKQKHYHIIFMDHMMPEMDGIEATQIIRHSEDEYYHASPIIALTANAIQGAKEEFLSMGMNDFVAKPIDINDIAEKIRHWLPEDLMQS